MLLKGRALRRELEPDNAAATHDLHDLRADADPVAINVQQGVEDTISALYDLTASELPRTGA
jgi:hypothetical protein